MISIAWVGKCSPKVQKLKEFLDFNSSVEKNIFVMKNISGKNGPSILISEDFEELQTAGIKFARSFQLYICNSASFLLSFQLVTKPPNRFYFHIEEQSFEELIFLIQKIGFLEVKNKKNSASIGLIPSMQNSMEVLRRITEERLFELRNFSHQEEDRRKNFHSLIQLARGLSMSRDIEEVVQYLWSDLRTVDGLKSITLLITDPSGHNHQILPKQGKFHFQEIQSLNEKQSQLINKFIENKLKKT